MLRLKLVLAVLVGALGFAQMASAQDCTMTLKANAAPNGQINAALLAPCHRGKAGLFHHAGLLVSFKTDLSGIAKMTLPALAADAVVIASFADGAGAVASLEFDEKTLPARIIFQSLGPVAARLQTQVTPLELGAVTEGYQARIYSFLDGLPDEGAVYVPIEKTNCTASSDIQMIQVAPGVGANLRDITVQIPSCDYLGQTIHLPVTLGVN